MRIFSILNVFIVCICNTEIFKLISILCTRVYSYMFSTVHPPRMIPIYECGDLTAGYRWAAPGRFWARSVEIRAF